MDPFVRGFFKGFRHGVLVALAAVAVGLAFIAFFAALPFVAQP